MSEQPHFAVLGPLEVTRAGQPVRLGSTRLRTLLATLLLHANRPVSITDLADRLWNDQPPGQARRTIQVYVVRLRQALGDADLISTDSTGYLIRVDAHHLDLSSFDNLVRDAARTTDVAKRAELLTKALALWRGPACADVVSDVLQAHEVPPLHERRLDAEEQLIDAELALGRHAEHLSRLRELVTEHPLRERFAAQLMLALYRSGRQADALDVYRSSAATLADELGLDPGPELQQLHKAVLTADPQLLAPVPVTKQPVPAQLPADTARFTGRSAELDELLRLSEHSRDTAVLISAVDGMAGVGKTALIVHAAHRLASEFPDGQLFIDLHGYTDGVPPIEPADALDRMLRALGIPGERVPTGLDERAAFYRSTLADRRILIVLDNASSADQVLHLLPGSPGCLVLITSRQRLTDLDAVHQFSLDVLPGQDAVALFIRVAGSDRLADTPPETLAEIVEACGRLPLAIRVAAARLRSRPVWTASHLAHLLRAHPLEGLQTGTRSVAAAFEVSYQHLDPDHRHMFRLLGGHPGADIDPHAAAALTDISLVSATRLLDDLVDAHLLEAPVPYRYRFHDLLRAYASSLAPADDQRHAALTRLYDHYASTATAAMDLVYAYETERRPRLAPSRAVDKQPFDEQLPAEAWLDVELPNLLAAAQHSTSLHAVHLSATLHRHLIVRGQHISATSLHERAVMLARATADRTGELAALNHLADVRWRLGHYELALEAQLQGLDLARAIGDQAGEHDALNGIGYVRLKQGMYRAAGESFAKAQAIARATGSRIGEHDALRGLGYVYGQQHKHEQAVAAYTEALGLARAVGHGSGEQAALHGLGYLHYALAQYESAAEMYRQGLTVARAMGHRPGELQSLAGLADVYYAQGQYPRAGTIYTDALTIADETGDINWQFEVQHGLGRTYHATGQLDQARVLHQRALTIATDLGSPNDQARAHDGLAHTYQALGDQEQARHHWQTALDVLATHAIDHTDDPQVTTDTIRARLAQLDRR